MNAVNSRLLTSLFLSEIMKMDPFKKTSGAVQTEQLKLASNACHREITDHTHNAISTNTLPDILKLADITLILKSGNNSIKENLISAILLFSLS